MSLQDDLRALQELRASRGWALLHEALQAEMMNLAHTMATDVGMPTRDIDYFRGVMSAAPRLLSAPDKYIARLEADIMLEQPLETGDP